MAIFDDDPRRDRPQPPSALRVATGRADGFVAPPLRYQASPRRRFASRRFADSTRRARHKRYRRLKTLCIKGPSVRERAQLSTQFSRGRWGKLKGTATVHLPSGANLWVELRWYEPHGIGPKKFKIKHFLE